MIAVGIVFVLLLGEIDLSVGSVSGLAGAIFAVLNVTHGMNEWLAFLLAILTGTVIGAVQGFFFARIGVPAFVVTLAGCSLERPDAPDPGHHGTINLDGEGLVAKLTSYYFTDVAAAYAWRSSWPRVLSQLLLGRPAPRGGRRAVPPDQRDRCARRCWRVVAFAWGTCSTSTRACRSPW